MERRYILKGEHLHARYEKLQRDLGAVIASAGGGLYAYSYSPAEHTFVHLLFDEDEISLHIHPSIADRTFLSKLARIIENHNLVLVPKQVYNC